jgi:hypothetical protein
VNKREAISFAAFRVLTDLFPEDKLNIERELINLGYYPQKDFRDGTTPSGIGLLAANNVLQDLELTCWLRGLCFGRSATKVQTAKGAKYYSYMKDQSPTNQPFGPTRSVW